MVDIYDSSDALMLVNTVMMQQVLHEHRFLHKPIWIYSSGFLEIAIMVQLSFFSTTIDTVYLAADSPRQAFYRLYLTSEMGHQVRLEKEWGAKQKILGHRVHVFKSLQKAKKEMARTIREKTNPNRKSKRIYKVDK